MTGVDGIHNYNDLLSTYQRLMRESDKPVTADRAREVLGEDVDVDHDGTVHLWELMQRTNEAHGRMIFSSITQLRSVDDKKYPQISEDNPLHIVLSIESEWIQPQDAARTYQVVNDIIQAARSKIDESLPPLEKMRELYRIIREDFGISYKETVFLSQGLSAKKMTADCDGMSFIFLAVAHELKWPVYIVEEPRHAFVFWKENKEDPICFNAASGVLQRGNGPRNVSVFADDLIKNQDNNIASFAYNALGAYVYSLGDQAEGIKWLNRSIELNDTSPNAFLNRGIVYLHMGDYEKSLGDLTRALVISPDFSSASSTRAKVYRKMGRLDEAQRDADSAIKTLTEFSAPGDCRRAYYIDAQVSIDRGEYSNAISYAWGAIRFAEDDKEHILSATKLRAIAYYFDGSDDLALGDVSTYLKAHPDDPELNLIKGSIARKKGNNALAIECYSKAIRNAGRIEDISAFKEVMIAAYHYRSLSYQAEGKPRNAEQDVAAYKEMSKKDPHSRYLM